MSVVIVADVTWAVFGSADVASSDVARHLAPNAIQRVAVSVATSQEYDAVGGSARRLASIAEKEKAKLQKGIGANWEHRMQSCVFLNSGNEGLAPAQNRQWHSLLMAQRL